MDSAKIIAEIDAQIASRSSSNFGIKVGQDLYVELDKAGRIKKAKFGVLGTKLWEHDALAYDGKYAISYDWELGNDKFVVGTPAT